MKIIMENWEKFLGEGDKEQDTQVEALHPDLQRIQTAAMDQAGTRKSLEQELSLLVGPRAAAIIMGDLAPGSYAALMAAIGVATE